MVGNQVADPVIVWGPALRRPAPRKLPKRPKPPKGGKLPRD